MEEEVIATAVALALAAAVGAAQDLDEHEEPCAIVTPTLAYRVEPFVDLFFMVRRLAANEESAPEIEGLDAAVAAARALQENLASSLDWGVIEGLLGDCDSGEKAVRRFAALPETFSTRARKDFALRAPALELARALAAAEPAFRAELWPAHEGDIAQARARIEGELGPRQARCLEAVTRDLAFVSTPLQIPVFLVHDGPWPGAVTQRDDGDRGICFVSVRIADGTQLFEAILHETLHALDLAGRGDTLDRLRQKLEQAGIARGSSELRDVPHALMFVEAGETIRRIVEPAHLHYGDSSGVYARLGPSALQVRRIWTEHLDGKVDREAALDAIVRAASPPVKR